MNAKSRIFKPLAVAAAVVVGLTIAMMSRSHNAASGRLILQELSPAEVSAIAGPRKGQFSEPALGATITAHVREDVDGKSWRIVSYPAASGELCTGVTWPGEGQAITCASRTRWFSQGPVSGQSGATQAEGQPLTWANIVVSGMVDASRVRSLELVSTDCSTRSVSTDADGFFLDVTTSSDIHKDVWPYELVARGANGDVVQTLPVEPKAPSTDAAKAAGVQAPVPSAKCA